MRSLSQDEARRIGAELKRWSQRPVAATNVRAVGLSVALTMLMLAGAHSLPTPTDMIRGFAATSATMLATMHFIALGTLRGLRRAGIAEAQEAMDAMRDPRRISAFDMAMTWLLIAGIARFCA